MFREVFFFVHVTITWTAKTSVARATCCASRPSGTIVCLCWAAAAAPEAQRGCAILVMIYHVHVYIKSWLSLALYCFCAVSVYGIAYALGEWVVKCDGQKMDEFDPASGDYFRWSWCSDSSSASAIGHMMFDFIFLFFFFIFLVVRRSSPCSDFDFICLQTEPVSVLNIIW